MAIRKRMNSPYRYLVMLQLLQYVSSQNFYYAKYRSKNEMCLRDSPFSKHYQSSNWKLHYTNPVVSSNTPDPGVLMLPDGLGYTVVSTSNFAVNSTEGAFKILHSKDLVHWTFVSCRLFLFKKPIKCFAVAHAVKRTPNVVKNQFNFHLLQMGYAFPRGQWPSWAYKDMWAPELYFIDGGYRLYFTARRGSDDSLCIGVAFSSHVNNGNDMAILSRPFKDLGEPILCEPQFQGAIDPYLVRDVRLDGHRLC